MKWTSWVTALALALVIGIVVWSSFRIGGARCEVCISFRDRQACRAVDANSADEARAAAITNACAQLVSGVTDTIACGRTPPDRVTCTP
jgi:hypothetical protein